MRSLYDILHLQAWYTRVRRMVCLRIREMAKRIHKSVLFETCFSLFNNQKAAPRLFNEGCLGRLFISFCSNRFCRRQGILIFSSLIIIFITSVVIEVAAQSMEMDGAVSPVEIGDQVPDSFWEVSSAMLNHPNGEDSLHFSNLNKEKLIILDFGGTICPPCVESLRSLQAIDENLSESFVPIGISSEGRDRVEPFLNSMDIQLPYIYDDQILKKYFPYSIIPHLVWIREGRVIHISGAGDASQANILKAISGENIIGEIKKDYYSYDSKLPLIIDGNGGESSRLAYHSAFTDYIPGLVGGLSISDHNMVFRNFGIEQLFVEIYSRLSRDRHFRFSNRKELNLPNDMLLVIQGKNDRDRFCYNFYLRDIEVPILERYRFILKEANDYFSFLLGIKSGIVNRNMPCWVLKYDASLKCEQETIENKEEEVLSAFELNNSTIASLHYVLAKQLEEQSYPVVTDLSPDAVVNIRLDTTITDPLVLSENLKPFGFYFECEERDVEILQIHQTNNP